MTDQAVPLYQMLPCSNGKADGPGRWQGSTAAASSAAMRIDPWDSVQDLN